MQTSSSRNCRQTVGAALLEELFTEKGLNLSVARVQVGANDYSTAKSTPMTMEHPTPN